MQTDAELAAQIAQRLNALAQITEEPGKLTRTYGSAAMRAANDLVATWMREAGMTTEQDAIGNLIGRYPATAEGCTWKLSALSPSPASEGGEGRGEEGRQHCKETPLPVRLAAAKRFGGAERGEGEASRSAKAFLLGSHLDTVRDAGRFDGALGVLVAVACVQKLHAGGQHLPFDLEVIAFADEEGVRFQSPYLGSRVLAGKFDFTDLKRRDAQGVELREAILRFVGDPDELLGARRDPKQILGYAEVHIEQGPVLDSKELPIGVVTGIAGQTRIEAIFCGQAGHAGTTPMSGRCDALVAAAQFIVEAETLGQSVPGLVVTVGELSVDPGASNVIPGRARLTVDVRHAHDRSRTRACESLKELADRIADDRLQRGLGWGLFWHIVQSTDAVPCSAQLSLLLKEAASKHVPDVIELPSGAGHDAAVMAAIAPVAMLFVRCKEGVSHHPAESAAEADVCVALRVMSDFVQRLFQRNG